MEKKRRIEGKVIGVVISLRNVGFMETYLPSKTMGISDASLGLF